MNEVSLSVSHSLSEPIDTEQHFLTQCSKFLPLVFFLKLGFSHSLVLGTPNWTPFDYQTLGANTVLLGVDWCRMKTTDLG